MLKKLLVAALACITLFLSQRTLTTESRARSAPQAQSSQADSRDKVPGAAAKATRTAVLF